MATRSRIKSLTWTQLMRVALGGYNYSNRIINQRGISMVSSSLLPEESGASCLPLTVRCYSCGSHMWVMARVCSTPSALFVLHLICSVSQPLSLPPSCLSHSPKLALFSRSFCNYFSKFNSSQLSSNCFFSGFRMKPPPLISTHYFFSFVLEVQKNKVTSVDAPEEHYDRIIKCEITACTDNLKGGMC